MPNKLKKLFSSVEKEKTALAEIERDNTDSGSPPPGYSDEADQYDRENFLEPPDITAGFRDLTIKSASRGLPDPTECIAHLKVLECFYRLKQTIGSHDGLFGINNSVVTDTGLSPNDKAGEILARLAEKRWAVYLQRAVDRFETWWASVTPAARMVTRSQLDRASRDGSLVKSERAEAPPLNITKHNVPPVDVLMVWHSYMLNPRAFFEDCVRYGRLSLWHTPMPWQAASDCIDPKTFAFEAGVEAQTSFTSITGLPWNNISDQNSKSVRCVQCSARVRAPWTTSFERKSWTMITSHAEFKSSVDNMLASGKGFCDKEFEVQCTECDTIINHDLLRTGKLVNDIKKLLSDDVPLAGTILGTEGIPGIAYGKRDDSTPEVQRMCNELMKQGLGAKTVAFYQAGKANTMGDIRDALETTMLNRKYMRNVTMSRHTSRTEKIAVRKMMSRYWDNSSPFALDLVGAVVRQGNFIEKMHNIDWLHSPALPSTMQRLIHKYSVFLQIIASFKTNMAVPTLDVDLAWHTHQLSSPARYFQYTVESAKQFIDHDDKVAETKLNEAFAWTSKTYERMTEQPYSECTCWYCEAVRESNTSVASRLFKTSSSQASDKLIHGPQDPRSSVHISAHNAVRPRDSDPTYSRLAAAKADELEKHFDKACERSRRNGRRVPKRDDYYYSDAYGYPVYLPAYSPYVGYVPYAPAYYPVTPGCMAVGAGAVGNCCSGTCGGGVAAGGCVGGGGCAGGAAGGCGGGGGGGGCGGGGGGCGGGGC